MIAKHPQQRRGFIDILDDVFFAVDVEAHGGFLAANGWGIVRKKSRLFSGIVERASATFDHKNSILPRCRASDNASGRAVLAIRRISGPETDRHLTASCPRAVV
jgi:hypothetical protein